MTQTNYRTPELGIVHVRSEIEPHYTFSKAFVGRTYAGESEINPDVEREGAYEINYVYVDPDFRGRNLGNLLIQHSLSIIRDDFNAEAAKICAVNERAFSAFTRFFGNSNSLAFYRREASFGPLNPLETDKDGAMEVLKGMRREQFADAPQSSEPLQGLGVHIYGDLSAFDMGGANEARAA